MINVAGINQLPSAPDPQPRELTDAEMVAELEALGWKRTSGFWRSPWGSLHAGKVKSIYKIMLHWRGGPDHGLTEAKKP